MALAPPASRRPHRIAGLHSTLLVDPPVRAEARGADRALFASDVDLRPLLD